MHLILEDHHKKTLEVLAEVADERLRQHAKWGEQNWADGTGDIFGGYATDFRKVCSDAAMRGAVTFRDILIEEVFEAFAETDPVRLRAELLQVAAVAVQWIEAIDRRQNGGAG